jgi:ABC-type branched-subunit amino acid transport system ATPase component
MSTIREVARATRRFGAITALDDLSFAALAGQVVV